MLKRFLTGFALVVMATGVISTGQAAEAVLAPQTSDAREIKVTAILQIVPNETKTWEVEVVLETHTKSLGDDLAKSSVLIADGKQYQPLSWEGAPPGGHHRKGKLHFRAIAPQPASVELQIRLAADPSPRSFKWLLK
jgi:hypothetical protein